MAFLSFEQRDPEKEKQRFVTRTLNEPGDVPTFTWGEENYDGLGDALVEMSDDLNEETFGDIGTIGKDFDFSSSRLPDVPLLESATAGEVAHHVVGSFEPSTGHVLGTTFRQPPEEHFPVHDEPILRSLAPLDPVGYDAWDKDTFGQTSGVLNTSSNELTNDPRNPIPQSIRLSGPRASMLRQQGQDELYELEHRLRLEDRERQLLAQQLVEADPFWPSNQFHINSESGPAMIHGQHQSYRSTDTRFFSPQELFPTDSDRLHLPEEQSFRAADQEALRVEAVRKIVETERMEERRRRKAGKLAHMARYNDLMTQSDKDFITRIQVSQLVTPDPYADDFYNQVYTALLQSRLGLQSQDERVLKFGSGVGVGLGVVQRGSGRRQSAMQKMEQQVERIITNSRRREEEKGQNSLQNLQGALGKTSGRSYKAAPRQLLQVDHSQSTAARLSHDEEVETTGAAHAAKLGREALKIASHAADSIRREPLSRRQSLAALERLYDLLLHVEKIYRDRPDTNDRDSLSQWQNLYDTAVDEMWSGTFVMEPLATSVPHPFISLLSHTKGKRLLPRISRYLSHQRLLTILTLVIACFSQLDVINKTEMYGLGTETTQQDADLQTNEFMNTVLQVILSIIAKENLRFVTGLVGLLIDRNDVVTIARTKPGLGLLTSFLTRVAVIRRVEEHQPAPEDDIQWQAMFDHLFEILAPYFLALFPSHATNFQSSVDAQDQPIWQFFAALALQANSEQHQILVTALRELILENVLSVKRGWVADAVAQRTRLANVDLFLNALGLDSSQIVV